MELKTITISDGSGREMVLEEFSSHGVTVPEGFVFDGASAPWWAWPLIPPYKKTKKAAVIHDYLCRQPGITWEEREEADKLFRTMLIEEGFFELRAYIGYLGVRLHAIYKFFIQKGLVWKKNTSVNS